MKQDQVMIFRKKFLHLLLEHEEESEIQQYLSNFDNTGNQVETSTIYDTSINSSHVNFERIKQENEARHIIY